MKVKVCDCANHSHIKTASTQESILIIPKSAPCSPHYSGENTLLLKSSFRNMLTANTITLLLPCKKNKPSLNINLQRPNLCLNNVPVCFLRQNSWWGIVFTFENISPAMQGEKNLHLDSASFKHSLLLLICFLLSPFSFFCFLIIASGYYVQSIDGNGWFWSMES